MTHRFPAKAHRHVLDGQIRTLRSKGCRPYPVAETIYMTCTITHYSGNTCRLHFHPPKLTLWIKAKVTRIVYPKATESLACKAEIQHVSLPRCRKVDESRPTRRRVAGDRLQTSYIFIVSSSTNGGIVTTPIPLYIIGTLLVKRGRWLVITHPENGTRTRATIILIKARLLHHHLCTQGCDHVPRELGRPTNRRTRECKIKKKKWTHTVVWLHVPHRWWYRNCFEKCNCAK